MTADYRIHRVVVKGQKAAEDPMKVVERVQRKSHRRVELISPIPPPKPEKEEEKEEEKPKVEEKKEEVKRMTSHFYSPLSIYISLSCSVFLCSHVFLAFYSPG